MHWESSRYEEGYLPLLPVRVFCQTAPPSNELRTPLMTFNTESPPRSSLSLRSACRDLHPNWRPGHRPTPPFSPLQYRLRNHSLALLKLNPDLDLWRRHSRIGRTVMTMEDRYNELPSRKQTQKSPPTIGNPLEGARRLEDSHSKQIQREEDSEGRQDV